MEIVVRKDKDCKRKRETFNTAMHLPITCFGNGKTKASAL
jgi:hypothetical protein